MMNQTIRDTFERLLWNAALIFLLCLSIAIVMFSLPGCSAKRAIANEAQKVEQNAASSEDRFRNIKEDVTLIEPSDDTESQALDRIDKNADAGVKEQQAIAKSARKVMTNTTKVEDSFGLLDLLKLFAWIAVIGGVLYLLHRLKLLPFIGPLLAKTISAVASAIGWAVNAVASLFKGRK